MMNHAMTWEGITNENCFFDIEKFTLTQVIYLKAPTAINCRSHQ